MRGSGRRDPAVVGCCELSPVDDDTFFGHNTRWPQPIEARLLHPSLRVSCTRIPPVQTRPRSMEQYQLLSAQRSANMSSVACCPNSVRNTGWIRFFSGRYLKMPIEHRMCYSTSTLTIKPVGSKLTLSKGFHCSKKMQNAIKWHGFLNIAWFLSSIGKCSFPMRPR